MSIAVNKSGTLHELSDISVNVGGALHSLDKITVNEGGVLREIFAKSASVDTTALTWSVDTSISGYDTNSKINSVSDDGLTIGYISRSPGSGNACICSNTFTLSEGAVISIAPLSISGNGTSADLIYAYLYNADGEEVTHDSTSAAQMETLTLTAESAGEYHIRLGGYSFTAAGSQSGVSYTYYNSTVSAEISFSL